MSTFSERMKTALHLRNIKQSQLSQKTGIDPGSISCYMSGRYEPKGDKLLALAKELRVSPEWLSGRNVPMKNDNSAVATEELTQTEIKLLELFRLVPEEQQASFLELGRVYANSLKKD